MKRPIRSGLHPIWAITFMLAGCQPRETAEQLQAWLDAQAQAHRAMAAQTHQAHQANQTHPPAAPPYHPFIYRADADSAPFGRAKTMPPAIFNTRPTQRAAAQPLENFPLESIQMIGTISQEGRRRVLLQADKLVYLAQTGDYAGQNFGMIQHIADHEISLEELIPGADSRWQKRIATLSLRGAKK